ncbi:hypothetical protein OXYTRIMIC_520 [Oxytricha trifallax]|uniref:Uncharacterized protein n=1 Tax=Oxytricha trifallax TaxID=1172189 RepID=A0A073HXT9_9SPIT|nr:hypothetical protein OXYTRIMIC_520 [Oxytricha trifallax]
MEDQILFNHNKSDISTNLIEDSQSQGSAINLLGNSMSKLYTQTQTNAMKDRESHTGGDTLGIFGTCNLNEINSNSGHSSDTTLNTQFRSLALNSNQFDQQYDNSSQLQPSLVETKHESKRNEEETPSHKNLMKYLLSNIPKDSNNDIFDYNNLTAFSPTSQLIPNHQQNFQSHQHSSDLSQLNQHQSNSCDYEQMADQSFTNYQSDTQPQSQQFQQNPPKSRLQTKKVKRTQQGQPSQHQTASSPNANSVLSQPYPTSDTSSPATINNYYNCKFMNVVVNIPKTDKAKDINIKIYLYKNSFNSDEELDDGSLDLNSEMLKDIDLRVVVNQVNKLI